MNPLASSPREEFVSKAKGSNRHNKYTLYKFYVGFCGKIYPAVEVQKSIDGIIKSNCYYSAEEYFKFLQDESIDLEKIKQERYFGSDYSFRTKDSIKIFFKSQSIFQKYLEPKFQEHKCPVFIYGTDLMSGYERKPILILNPSLIAVKFAKVKDPATAFQDLYMFISGVLGVETKPMIEISDRDKQKKYGHDSFYSFKKISKKGQWR